MPIAKNSVLWFHYTLNDGDGRLLDTSAGRDAFAYIHGSGMIVPLRRPRPGLRARRRRPT